MTVQASRKARAVGAALLTLGTVAALAACSSGSNSSNTGTPAGTSTSTGSGSTASSSGGTYNFWDPYPQYNATSDWTKLVESCGTQNGVTIKRTGY
ncbi:MAG TPA: hypothetical protein VNH17_08150, partial [Streptosporangiaceae bacterium]|nr:hypothetical protein [Streptosporangiaceae bacterium]